MRQIYRYLDGSGIVGAFGERRKKTDMKGNVA